VVQTNIVSEPAVRPVVPSTSTGVKQTPSLFRKKEEAKAEINEPEVAKRETHFDQQALDVAWRLFADVRSKMNTGDAEKLVLSRKLEKREGNEVQIILDSQLEMSILEKVEQDLVQFMRKALSNDHIFLTKSVQEHSEIQMLYTSKDKYAYMVEQNPALSELKDRLGLDFEY
jgi:hypothetical protein